MKLNHMFSPISINGMTLKNRIIMNPIMSYMLPGGYCTDRFKEFYWRRAEGGPGMVIVGGAKYDDYGCGPEQISLRDDSFIPGYKEFVDGMHERGTMVGVQLYGAGAYAFKADCPEGDCAFAPSAIKSKFTRGEVREITQEEIKTVIESHAAAALRAKQAGFDMVEILGSAGYLICQFLSPSTNHRTDEYGGSLENRLRFPLELIRATREAVGPDYPLCMRMAGNDFVPGANTNDDAVVFAQAYEKAGINVLNVTGGWHESTVPQITGDLPVSGLAYLAEAIKRVVSIPVIVGNRNSDPETAERIIAMGQADIIGCARPFVADPDYALKMQEGRFDEIKRCVGCNQGCLSKSFIHQPIGCILNGMASHESEIHVEKTDNPKRILVVGGGPAGCEFALMAAERGHAVTIWDKADSLGGALPLVAAPPAKAGFRHIIEYYNTVVPKRGIEVVLNKEAGAEDILEAGFDEIVIATGAIPKTIPLDNPEGKILICNAEDVLAGKVIPGKDIVVIGGSSVGCETAQFLGRQGTVSPEQVYWMLENGAETTDKVLQLMHTNARNITIVEILKRIGKGFDPGTGWPVMKELKQMGVKTLPLTTVQQIGKETVTLVIMKEDGEETVTIPCDTIVLAVGYDSEQNLFSELKDRCEHVHLIGDAQKVGKISNAIEQAIGLAIAI